MAMAVTARSIAPLPAPLLPNDPLVARTGTELARSPKTCRMAAASDASWSLVPTPKVLIRLMSSGPTFASAKALEIASDNARPSGCGFIQ